MRKSLVNNFLASGFFKVPLLQIESFSSSSNLNENLFDEMEMKNNICFCYAMIVTNSFEFCSIIFLEEAIMSSMDLKWRVHDMLCMMQRTFKLVKTLINFSFNFFEKFRFTENTK